MRVGNALPLCAGTLSVKPCQQLPRGQMRYRIAPIGGDFAQGHKDKAALAKLGMRDGEAGRRPNATAPRDNVEIKRPIPPATTATSAVGAFDFLELFQQRVGPVFAFDHHDSIGIRAGAGANGATFSNSGAQYCRISARGLPHRVRWLLPMAMR
jgi:hypothetical protein